MASAVAALVNAQKCPYCGDEAGHPEPCVVNRAVPGTSLAGDLRASLQKHRQVQHDAAVAAPIDAACRRCGVALQPDEHPYCAGCLAYHQDRRPAPGTMAAALNAAVARAAAVIESAYFDRQVYGRLTSYTDLAREALTAALPELINLPEHIEADHAALRRIWQLADTFDSHSAYAEYYAGEVAGMIREAVTGDE
jgi:hypothetical protein